MRRRPIVFVLASIALGLCGCSSGTNLLGSSKLPPDEFAVFSRAPLSLPPGYGDRPYGADTLPAPGGAPERFVAQQPQIEARQALLGMDSASAQRRGGPVVPTSAGTAPAVPSTPGVLALYRQTGADDADPDIRSLVNKETQLLAEADQTFIEQLMFWRSPQEYGTVVDASRETRRIQENQALGQPVVVGPTPTIERKPKGLFEGIF